MAMVESPRFCWDDVSDEPERLIRGIADTMTAMGSWNMHARSDMVVAMSPSMQRFAIRLVGAGMTFTSG
ncbi:MAG: hypothetical protein Ct9H300mP11_24660 [Chloroflexota bacterium]|nr:MAG: hypothetical protein Ct9H300mP11_24660 [Chloroflexota bacterium]